MTEQHEDTSISGIIDESLVSPVEPEDLIKAGGIIEANIAEGKVPWWAIATYVMMCVGIFLCYIGIINMSITSRFNPELASSLFTAMFAWLLLGTLMIVPIRGIVNKLRRTSQFHFNKLHFFCLYLLFPFITWFLVLAYRMTG